MLLIASLLVLASPLEPDAHKDVHCAAAIVVMRRQATDDDSSSAMASRVTVLQVHLGRLSTRKEGIDWNVINKQADDFSKQPAETGRILLSCPSAAPILQMPIAE